MMLKKIHFAEPVIKYADQRKHERSTEKLKKQIMQGNQRMAMMQAARDIIIRSSGYYSKRRASSTRKLSMSPACGYESHGSEKRGKSTYSGHQQM
jgi:hypothetical protein